MKLKYGVSNVVCEFQTATQKNISVTLYPVIVTYALRVLTITEI